MDKENLEHGGVFYEKRHLFPSLIINKENYESFKSDIENLKNTNLVMGREFARIYSVAVNLYGIMDASKTGEFTPIQQGIIETGKVMMNILSLSLKETTTIEDKLIDSDSFAIDGHDYSFIAHMLLFLPWCYNEMLNRMREKIYLNQEDSQTLRDNLIYLLSPGFEGLRKKFKVLECWQMVLEDSNEKKLLH